MATVIEVKYFNTFLLKKVFENGSSVTPKWNGSFGIPYAAGGWSTYPSNTNVNAWVIEESRTQGGYNNTTVDLGVKAYLVEEDNTAVNRSNSLIYSGIFNSRTGVNNTNQFPVGEEISKSLNPANGSIQKIYAEDTNLIIFQENKVSRALIDKDAIYSAEGAGTLTSSNVVIGQVQAYAGNYGISRDPQSFAVYGYRKYFTDRDRNAVLRLSQDGITEISEYGMSDFFRDEFSNIDNPIALGGVGKVIGGWDSYNKQYVVSLQNSNPAATIKYNTLGFSEQVNGFTSFFSFDPSQIVSLKNKFYTVKNARLWVHYSQVPNTRCNFYNIVNKSSITFILNDNPSAVKIFNTVNYEGSNGWQVDSFESDLTGQDLVSTLPPLVYTSTYDSVGNILSPTSPAVFSYMMGAYDNYGNEYPSAMYPPINRAGFDRKENKYMAVLINKTLANQGEIIYGTDMSGIKGYFATVTMSTDSATDAGGGKELFTVSTNYNPSSY